MEEGKRGAPKIDWGRAERISKEQQPIINQLRNRVEELVTPRLDKQRLIEYSGGKVNEYPEPEYLDIRAATDTINALRKLGVVNEDQMVLIPGNLEQIIAKYVVNERTIYQIGHAANPNNPQIFEPASIANKLK